jgi:hypothetical protein
MHDSLPREPCKDGGSEWDSERVCLASDQATMTHGFNLFLKNSVIAL